MGKGTQTPFSLDKLKTQMARFYFISEKKQKTLPLEGKEVRRGLRLGSSELPRHTAPWARPNLLPWGSIPQLPVLEPSFVAPKDGAGTDSVRSGWQLMVAREGCLGLPGLLLELG